VDLEALGCRYTWIKKENGRTVLRKRLDRVVTNLEFRDSFSEAKLVNLPRASSDHHPILLNLTLSTPPDQKARPKRFEAAWLTNENFKSVFQETWEKHKEDIDMAVRETSSACHEWNLNEFGNIFRRLRTLKARLSGVQNSVHYMRSSFLQNLERELIDQYQKTLREEELFWCQKSRIEWIQSGDRNTNFYHNNVKIRRSRNKIGALKIGDDWVTDVEVLKSHVRDYFITLFSCKDTNTPSWEYSAPHPTLESINAESLLRPASMEEF